MHYVKIFCAPLKDNSQIKPLQIVICQGRFKNISIPVPINPEEPNGGINIINMEYYLEIFDDLNHIFLEKYDDILLNFTHEVNTSLKININIPEKSKYGYISYETNENSQKDVLFAYVHFLRPDKRLFIPTEVLREYKNWCHEIFAFNVKIDFLYPNKNPIVGTNKAISLEERKFTSNEQPNDYGIQSLLKFKSKMKTLKFPMVTNIVKIIIQSNWNYIHNIIIPTNYTLNITKIQVAPNGCQWVNNTKLLITYEPYGFRFCPKIDEKFLLPKKHIGGKYCKFIKDLQNNNVILIVSKGLISNERLNNNKKINIYININVANS